MDDYSQKIMNILYPKLIEDIERVKAEKLRFVHYTTAESLLNILSSREIWLRQPKCMNDYSEIEHGISCLIKAYNSSEETGLKKSIDNIYEGLSIEIEKAMNEEFYHLRENCFIFCISEHKEVEDKYGRLSMWRAYGKETGVGFVIRNDNLFEEGPFDVVLLPVNYIEDEGFLEILTVMSKNIDNNVQFIKSLDREEFKQYLLYVLRGLTLSTKHPGFEEEKEWRIIYTPHVFRSKHMLESVLTVKGVPQIVYRLPIQKIPNKPGSVDFNDLLDRIIIGPTEYAFPVAKAFINLLLENGIKKPGNKIFFSNIPLRQ